MEARLNSIISATFLTSLRTRILKINLCKYSICSVYVVKSLSFFSCEAIFIIFPRKLIVTSLPPTPLLFLGLLPRISFTDPVFTSFYFIDCRCFILIPRWLAKIRFDASNFNKSVHSQLAKRLIFVTLRINDILTALSIIVAAIVTRYYFFNKDISQKEKLTAPYPGECFEFWFT